MTEQVGENEKLNLLTLDIKSEWDVIEKKVDRFIRVPDFVVYNSRQVMRLTNGRMVEMLPFHIMSSMVENIRRSGSYTSGYYFAGRNLYPEKLAGSHDLRIKDMISWFTPTEALCLLMFIYFNRYLHLRSIENGWSRLNPFFRRDVALGRRIGEAWPAVKPGRGMLIAGLRRIAQGFMILAYPKLLDRFQRIGMFEEEYSSSKDEIELCGFSHMTMASYLSQTCGLGVSVASSFNGIDSFRETGRSDEMDWREIHYFLEQFKSGKTANEIASKTKLAEGDKRATLDEYLKKIRTNKSIFSWLDSTKEDMKHLVNHKIVDLE